jgi:Ca2+/H+ antiporter
MTQKFNKTLARATASTLLLAVIALIILAVFISTMVTVEGESNWLEGVQLLMFYAIMAIAFFFVPGA